MLSDTELKKTVQQLTMAVAHLLRANIMLTARIAEMDGETVHGLEVPTTDDLMDQINKISDLLEQIPS